MKYLIKKRGFEGRYSTEDKYIADLMLEPGTVITCIDNGRPTMSYGCVYATEVDPSLQLPAPNKK
jgi:hypothetical protein